MSVCLRIDSIAVSVFVVLFFWHIQIQKHIYQKQQYDGETSRLVHPRRVTQDCPSVRAASKSCSHRPQQTSHRFSTGPSSKHASSPHENHADCRKNYHRWRHHSPPSIFTTPILSALSESRSESSPQFARLSPPQSKLFFPDQNWISAADSQKLKFNLFLNLLVASSSWPLNQYICCRGAKSAPSVPPPIM